jgi:hypothetical protein
VLALPDRRSYGVGENGAPVTEAPIRSTAEGAMVRRLLA